MGFAIIHLKLYFLNNFYLYNVSLSKRNTNMCEHFIEVIFETIFEVIFETIFEGWNKIGLIFVCFVAERSVLHHNFVEGSSDSFQSNNFPTFMRLKLHFYCRSNLHFIFKLLKLIWYFAVWTTLIIPHIFI